MKWSSCIIVTVFVTVCLGSLDGTPVQRQKRAPICTLNICNFASPCLNAGTCVFNSTTCTVKCVCAVGYTGSYCEQEISKDSPSTKITSTRSPLTTSVKTTTEIITKDPKTPVCVMNICNFASPCLNAGSCVLNSTTCTVKCVCVMGYSGIYCEQKVSNDPPTTKIITASPLTSSSVKTTTTATTTTHVITKDPKTPICTMNICNFASPCLNSGTCVFNFTTCTVKCVCLVGYTGSYCEQELSHDSPSTIIISTPSSLTNNSVILQDFPVISTTPGTTANVCTGFNLCMLSRVCLNGGTCEFTSSCEVRCHCTGNFTGQHCEKHVSQDFTDLSTTTQTTVTTTLRPLENRSCDGFVCYHGVCDAELLLSGQYRCLCDDGFYGHFCQTPCQRNCSVNGVCKLNETTNVEYCNCAWPYTGDYCGKIIPKELAEAGWVWWVVGSCTFLLVLLVLLLVLLPYWMWRKRDVFIMKIVYYFQPYEDDDKKQFDAFISYKSTQIDEDFVLNTLYPVLEKELNFKLCLHQRDFIPGETIANNIIWAIENSRRTILVLTPNYLESEFTRFEWQRAHTEMLKMKHKVVPIILEDIKEARSNMDGTMKTILDSITYIVWPGVDEAKSQKKFWKQVELSMPKKKHSEESSSKNKDPCILVSSKKHSENMSKVNIDLDISGNFLSEKCFFNNAFELSVHEEDTDKVTFKNGDVLKEERSVDQNGGFVSSVSIYEEPIVDRNEQIKRFFDHPVEHDTYALITNKAIELESHLEGDTTTDV